VSLILDHHVRIFQVEEPSTEDVFTCKYANTALSSPASLSLCCVGYSPSLGVPALDSLIPRVAQAAQWLHRDRMPSVPRRISMLKDRTKQASRQTAHGGPSTCCLTARTDAWSRKPCLFEVIRKIAEKMIDIPVPVSKVN